MKKTLIRGGTVVTAEAAKKADVLIGLDWTIEDLGSSLPVKHDMDVIDATGLLVFPLLTDCHVHFREPGLTHKATMATEAKAALAGGVGTVCEMPNTIPPTVTIAALADKVHIASAIAGCTIKFFFGVTEQAHLQALRELWTGDSLECRRLKNHCAGVKLYLDHSTGNQKVETSVTALVFAACAELKIPVVIHCEDPTMNASAAKANTRTDIAAHSEIRPPTSEAKAIETVLALVRTHKTAVHIAHLSTAQGVDLVRAAKKEGLPVTCEVTPHHLFLHTGDYAVLGTLAKVNPPIRPKEHSLALWQGIADGTVDCISTDHAPHTLEEKKVLPPLSAPSGMPGVELLLPLLLTVAAGSWPRPDGGRPTDVSLTYPDIVRLCQTNPERIFRLNTTALKKGSAARIALVNPQVAWSVAPSALHSKCGWSPYESWSMKGGVVNIMQQ